MHRGLSLSLIALSMSACGNSGSIELLTYNVAGLPEGLSGSNPEVNIPLIGPKLNAYPLVLVQEDFSYHHRLERRPTHEFRSEPKENVRAVNDGLNRFSRVPFGTLHRETWAQCNGTFDSSSDCLADKGFSAATTSITEGGVAVVVNLHFDAGGGDDDSAARTTQVDQLLAYLSQVPADQAMVVAGDFNLKVNDRPEDKENYDRLISGLGLRDACLEVDCQDIRIDKVLFRSGEGLDFEVLSWRTPDEFVDDAGADLSDHLPVAVVLAWGS